jgi:hypothetical protein
MDDFPDDAIGQNRTEQREKGEGRGGKKMRREIRNITRGPS